MNYCTLEDAWKYSDSLTEQFKLKKNIEKFTSENNNNDNDNNDNNYNNEYDYDFKLDNDFINDITKDINSTKDINNNIYHNNNNNNNNNNIHASSHYNDAFICDDFLDHLETCKICRAKMRKRFKSNVIERIENLIIDNKDAILLLLLILFALIFCNLIILIFK
jgi:hypothetical protein